MMFFDESIVRKDNKKQDITILNTMLILKIFVNKNISSVLYCTCTLQLNFFERYKYSVFL